MTKILVIDDNVDLLRLIELKLSQDGYRVALAENGFEGLEQAGKFSPDLIILDIMMPEMDGWEFTERLRQVSNVPILMLTAKSEDDDVVKGLKLGADEYLTKPFRLNTLSARVEALLRRQGWEKNAASEDVDQLKTNITDAVSHELRAPVTMILNALDLALREAFRSNPKTQRDFIEEAHSNAVVLKRLIDDLLMLVQIDQGLEVFRRPILVHPQLQNLFNIFESSIQNNKITARFTCPEGLSSTVDQPLFKQAIQHLLTNAIKHTPEDGKIMVVAEEKGDGILTIDFHDEGPGIDETKQNEIFDRFFQSAEGNLKTFSGLGVGLHIARAVRQSARRRCCSSQPKRRGQHLPPDHSCRRV